MSIIEVEIARADRESLRSYLQGALRDGTASPRHRTHRFGQSDPAWLEVIRSVLTVLGHRAWTYREGRSRSFWILETGADFLDVRFDPCSLIGRPAVLAFARGYFDADGGMPRNDDARLYLQYTQKDRADLERLHRLLEAYDISCGRIHNPSVRVDPDYWRFFVRAASWSAFLSRVSSWHPIKRSLIEARRRKMARGVEDPSDLLAS